MIKTRFQIIIALLATIAIGLILWFSVGLRMADRLFEPWVVFEIPKHAQPLSASLSVADRTVHICNRDNEIWRDILIRIEAAYVFRMNRLDPTRCRNIAVSEFAYSSWKKLPPPNNLIPKKVEILTKEPKNGYISWSAP